MLLYEMTPDEAIRLVEEGITGIDAIAREPATLRRLASDGRFPGLQTHRKEWVEQAAALINAQHAGWRSNA